MPSRKHGEARLATDAIVMPSRKYGEARLATDAIVMPSRKYGEARLATDAIVMPSRKYTICMPDNEGRNTRTHTLIIFSTYHFSMVAMVTRTRIMLHYTCIACLVSILNWLCSDVKSPVCHHAGPGSIPLVSICNLWWAKCHRNGFFSKYFGSGSTVVKVLCYKSEGRWVDPSWCHWIFH